jgi:SAM-dependent methyltransferase
MRLIESDTAIIAGIPLHWTLLRDATDGGGTGEDGVGLWVPQDPDLLLDQMTQEDFESNDERMPYFGTIWPSAESLVPWILARPAMDGTTALDLGCGLGACGFALADRGAAVTFFDWEPRALDIVAASVERRRPGPAAITYTVGDWRHPPPLPELDLVVAADVLYEERNGPAVAAFLAQALKPGGTAWIGDPGRIHARSFPDHVRRAGLELLARELLPPQPHEINVELLIVRRPP